MRYFSEDVSRFEDLKEYIDTAMIGLVRLSFGEERSEEMERVMELSAWMEEVERQLQGRLFLLPPFIIYGGDPAPHHFAALRTSFKDVLLVPFQEEPEHGEELTSLQESGMKREKGVILLNKPKSSDDLYEQIMALWNESVDKVNNL